MKRKNVSVVLVAVALLSGSFLAAAFDNSINGSAQVNLPAPTPQPFQLQIVSPLDNFAYGNYNGPLNITSDQAAHQTTYSLIIPLNITANEETSRITYSLDGSDNMTFNENTTATLTLNYGVHNLTAYATNIEDIASVSNITFTVGYDYPLSMKITMEQVREATSYFESRGLKAQIFDERVLSDWHYIASELYAGSVDVVSKENFADVVIAHGIDTIWVYQDSNQVSFYIRVYGQSWLPIFYAYSATIV
jgi:hypothetical protein